MTAPHSLAYHPPGEVDDPPFVTLVSTHQGATHPVIEPLTLKEAENVVLYHCQQWNDEQGDIRVTHACCIADLGKWVPPTSFAELAWDYRDNFTPHEADTWTYRLTQYLTQNGWTE